MIQNLIRYPFSVLSVYFFVFFNECSILFRLFFPIFRTSVSFRGLPPAHISEKITSLSKLLFLFLVRSKKKIFHYESITFYICKTWRVYFFIDSEKTKKLPIHPNLIKYHFFVLLVHFFVFFNEFSMLFRLFFPIFRTSVSFRQLPSASVGYRQPIFPKKL